LDDNITHPTLHFSSSATNKNYQSTKIIVSGYSSVLDNEKSNLPSSLDGFTIGKNNISLKNDKIPSDDFNLPI
jgi:hypothetical protein